MLVKVFAECCIAELSGTLSAGPLQVVAHFLVTQDVRRKIFAHSALSQSGEHSTILIGSALVGVAF